MGRKAAYVGVGVGVVNVLVLGWVLLSLRDGGVGGVYRMDLDVYRVAVGVWWGGGDLYGELPRLLNGLSLPYLYPPFAVVVLAPFALGPFWLGSAVFAVVTVATVVVVLVVVLRALEVRVDAVLVGVLLPVALFVEPVRETLYFGQVNVLLMGLVVADCLVRSPRWPRGVLVGVAAAVKLTPALFVLFFLLRGDRRAAVTAGVAFLVATGVGFLASWSNSVRFWSHEVVNSAQSRGMSNEMNQSIKVVLVRFGVDPDVVWPVLAVVVLGLAVVGMRRAFAAGWPSWALGVNALAVLLISPVSYSHHWVWVVPILLTGAVAAWRNRRPVVVAATVAGTVLVLIGPHWWWDPQEPWHAWRLLTGNAYAYAAVVALVLAALGSKRREDAPSRRP